MNVKQILLGLLMCTAGFTLVNGQEGHQLQYLVKDLNGKAYLLSIKGNTYDVADSCIVQNGLIRFDLPEGIEPGMYRMSFADSLYTDVIINHEDIRLENELADLQNKLRVLSSEENRIYYAYWKNSGLINDTINQIAQEGNLLYEASGHVLTPQLDSMQRKANMLNRRLNSFTDSLISVSGNLLVGNIIRAYKNPDYYAYLKTPGSYPYKNVYEFLRDHYFDHIAITDDRLLHTEVLYVTITHYLNTFGDPQSTENYSRAADTIMKRLSPNPKMSDYALTLMLNTFEHSTWEKVFTHLVDTYVSPNSCEIEGASEYLALSEVIRNLEIGKPAPPLVMKDYYGKEFSLVQSSAKVTLLVFWSSECPHCHAIMPSLMGLYDQWHAKGLEIVAISIDTDEKAWKEAAHGTDLRWTHLCDMKGFDSEVLKHYNTWKTPGFFVLDAQKVIVAKPLLVSQIEDTLEKYLK